MKKLLAFLLVAVMAMGLCSVASAEGYDQALIDAADSIARPGDGKLRTLVKYLELAAEYSERKGVPITAEMLLQFRGRFEDGGAWEEDR